MSTIPLRSASERESLAVKFTPTVKRIARAWGKKADTREEHEGDCFLKLAEVIDAEPDEKLTEPFVAEVLRNHLRSVHALSNRDGVIPAAKMTSLDEIVRFEDGNEASRYETIPDPNAIDPESAVLADEEEASAEQLRNLLSRLLVKLPIKHRRAVSMVYGLQGSAPVTVTDVAKRLHVSRVTLYKYLDTAIESLREGFAEAGFAIPAGQFEEVLLARAA